MRNFEQRIAEINRRSEKILTQRKLVRRRILIGCVPVVLCIGLCSALILPGRSPTPSVKKPTANSGVTVHRHQNFISPVTKIQISGAEVTREVQDAAQIAQICQWLDTYTGNGGSTPSQTQENDGSVNAYTVTLTQKNGTASQYLLTETILKDLNSNQAYALTENQLEELLDLLGIPHA